MNLRPPPRRTRPPLRALLLSKRRPPLPPRVLPLMLQLLLPPLLLLPLCPPLRPELADMQGYRKAQAINSDRGGANGRKGRDDRIRFRHTCDLSASAPRRLAARVLKLIESRIWRCRARSGQCRKSRNKAVSS
jgi:hypothetical protein